MTPAMSLVALPARPELQVSHEPQLVYLLLRARTDVALEQRLPLNICLVLDRSSSMRGERLFQVKEAARHLVGRLDRGSAFGLVAFNDRAEVIVPSQTVHDVDAIRHAIANLDARGGTEMAQGLALGLQQIERPLIHGISRLILLTDGRTYGDEHACVELARRAQRRGIGITALGVGTEWNEDLLETMTAGPNSRTQYITSSSAIGPVFAAELERLQNTVAQSVELEIVTRAETQVRACYRVQPFLSALPAHPADGGRWRASIGEWAAGDDHVFLIELVIPPVTSGTHTVARIDLRYDLISGNGPATASVTVQLPAVIAASLEVHADVRAALERVVAYQLQARAWQSVAEGRIDEATKRLQMAGTHLFNAGEIALAETAHAEATRLLQGSSPSADGRKRIKLGTRGLIDRGIR